jgi:hypothetical protein
VGLADVRGEGAWLEERGSKKRVFPF